MLTQTAINSVLAKKVNLFPFMTPFFWRNGSVLFAGKVQRKNFEIRTRGF
jgi:hypothetical protein